MAPMLWLMWKYLGGSWPPRATSQARHHYLRANRVPAETFATALLAGAMSIIALTGLWIVTAQIVRMPSNVLPGMAKYSWLTTASIITMGSILGPVLEQAGIWGYCQGILEREFSGRPRRSSRRPCSLSCLILRCIWRCGRGWFSTS